MPLETARLHRQILLWILLWIGVRFSSLAAGGNPGDSETCEEELIWGCKDLGVRFFQQEEQLEP